MRAGQPPPGVTLLRPPAPSMPPTVTATPRVPSLVSLRPQDGHMPLSHSSRNLQVREPHQDFTWRRVLMLETNESRSKYCELETCTSWCKANRDESINMTSEEDWDDRFREDQRRTKWRYLYTASRFCSAGCLVTCAFLVRVSEVMPYKL